MAEGFFQIATNIADIALIDVLYRQPATATPRRAE